MLGLPKPEGGFSMLMKLTMAVALALTLAGPVMAQEASTTATPAAATPPATAELLTLPDGTPGYRLYLASGDAHA